MILPEYVRNIINKLEANGFSAYAVGGCVRDSLLGILPDDYDVATNATPQQIKDVFDYTIDTGIRHGTVTVMCDKCSVEVTTYRTEGKYISNRRPEEVRFIDDIYSDLSRRDFTINAMAYNPKTGMVDPFNGQDDLKCKLVRCVGDAYVRFSEDALRMLRAIRFSCSRGFEIEARTKEAIVFNSALIKNISVERIASELTKSLMSDFPERIRLLYDCGLSKHFIPFLDLCMKTGQNTPYHMYNVGEHCVKSVSYAPMSKYVRLAAFLHDCGKPQVKTTDSDGTDHFKGHEAASASIAAEILKKLKFDKTTIKIVSNLIKYHGCCIASDAVCIRKMINKIGTDNFSMLLQLMYADSKAHSKLAAAERTEKLDRITEIYNVIISNADPVTLGELALNGKDLQELGLKGNEIGQMLDYIMDRVLKNPALNSKEELINIARGCINK